MEKLERRIQILKMLQGKEMRTSEIAEKFDVDERTIRTDLEALRDGLDIFGVKIQIESKHYEGNPKQYYKSTVHPIILALNASELFALLKLLEKSIIDDDNEVYKHVFNQVYSQITDYAEKLFAGKLKGEYKKEDIINILEEEAFANSKDYKLIFWEKSGRLIDINYFDENQKDITKKARLLHRKGNILKIEDANGNVSEINYNDVMIDWAGQEYK